MKTALFKLIGTGSTLAILGQLAFALFPEYVAPFCGAL